MKAPDLAKGIGLLEASDVPRTRFLSGLCEDRPASVIRRITDPFRTSNRSKGTTGRIPYRLVLICLAE
jgi:hypothetical protein